MFKTPVATAEESIELRNRFNRVYFGRRPEYVVDLFPNISAAGKVCFAVASESAIDPKITEQARELIELIDIAIENSDTSGLKSIVGHISKAGRHESSGFYDTVRESGMSDQIFERLRSAERVFSDNIALIDLIQQVRAEHLCFVRRRIIS